MPYAIPINFDSQDDTHTFFYILSLKGWFFCSENQCGKHFNFFFEFSGTKNRFTNINFKNVFDSTQNYNIENFFDNVTTFLNTEVCQTLDCHVVQSHETSGVFKNEAWMAIEHPSFYASFQMFHYSIFFCVLFTVAASYNLYTGFLFFGLTNLISNSLFFHFQELPSSYFLWYFCNGEFFMAELLTFLIYTGLIFSKVFPFSCVIMLFVSQLSKILSRQKFFLHLLTQMFCRFKNSRKYDYTYTFFLVMNTFVITVLVVTSMVIALYCFCDMLDIYFCVEQETFFDFGKMSEYFVFFWFQNVSIILNLILNICASLKLFFLQI